MNCTNCTDKVCRKYQNSCSQESFDSVEIINQYREAENSKIIVSAAQLVDNHRAGKLSRIDEIIEFATSMNYKKIGLAYCYGMELYAGAIQAMFTEKGFLVSSVSCSVGGLEQSETNAASCIHNVSCNPLGQAHQLNSENVDLTLIIGICMGHDILLQRNLKMDFTTFVVKDRVHHHNPLLAIN
jgi:uncharacterized metal-binding protein